MMLFLNHSELCNREVDENVEIKKNLKEKEILNLLASLIKRDFRNIMNLILRNEK